MESEAVKWHRQMKEEKKQCWFYSGCTNKKRTITLTTDNTKYKICKDCMKRFIKEHPKTKIEVSKVKL